MSVVQHPFSGFQGIIDGILQGHAIATHRKNQSMHEEAFQRQKQREDRDAQTEDIRAQMEMSQYGLPVTPGSNMVEQQFDHSTPETLPGVGGGTNTVKFARPVDRSRLLKRKLSDGRELQVEGYTPEQFAKRASDQAMQSKRGGAIFDQQTTGMLHDYELATRGVPLPDDIAQANGYPQGSKVLPSELAKLSENAASVRQKNRGTVAPGASEVDFTPERSSPFGGNAPMVGAKPDAEPFMPELDGPPVNPLIAAGQKNKDGAASATNKARVLFANPAADKPTGDLAAFESAFAPGWYAEQGITLPTPKDKKAAWAAFQGQKSESSVSDVELELRAARGDKDAKAALASAEQRRLRIAAAGRDPSVHLDREIAQYGKPFDEIVKGSDSQLDKILDAERMIAGGAISQALGVPKILTALVSGQGSGVRITQAELNSIASARGLTGNIEGFFSKLSGNGNLTGEQKKQMQGILEDVRTRIVEKKLIARQAGNDMYAATDRAGVLAAAKKGKEALDAHSQKGSGGAPAAGANPYR